MQEREDSLMTSFWPDWVGRCVITGMGDHSRILGKASQVWFGACFGRGPVGLWLLLDQLLEGSRDLSVLIEPGSTRLGHSIWTSAMGPL